MRSASPRAVAVACLLALASSLPAQVQVEHAEPPPGTVLIEIRSPMRVEISLAETAERPGFDKLPVNRSREYSEMDRYVCDKLRVRKVRISKRPSKKGRVELLVSPTITTEWYRQEIALTAAVVSGAEEIRSEKIKKLVVGRENAASALGAWGSSTTKTPEIVFAFTEAELAALYAAEGEPALRLTVEILE